MVESSIWRPFWTKVASLKCPQLSLDLCKKLQGWNNTINCEKITRTVPVVYVDQCLGAAHSKRWLKYAFSIFCAEKLKKMQKSKKFAAEFGKKMFF